MTKTKRLFVHTLVALVITASALSLAPRTAQAGDPEFDAITKYLKQQFNAKRISIPFLGLANFFVKVVRPAGVKSFKVAIFENLNVAPGQAHTELGLVIRNALSPQWQPLVRIRSREGEQTHVYAREDGKNIKLMVVTLDRTDAVVARVKISPQRLAEFVQNPKILGISLNR
jgi:hypothetical protein